MPALNPPRRLLFGPGPSQVESRVYEAMSKPLVGYLDPFLYQVFDEVRSGLRAVFGTKNPFTLVIPGTGSSGMETAVTNFVEPARRSLNAWRFLPRPECDKPRCAVNNEI